MCEGSEHGDGTTGRRGLRSLFTNWREYDAPLTTKLRLSLRNGWIRWRTGSLCCGNDGEPGC
jgi:hypothetical protein